MDAFMEKTAVIGAGLMGTQIALVLALGSRRTTIVSRRQESLDKAAQSLARYLGDLERHDGLLGSTRDEIGGRIALSTSVEEAVDGAEFVVESITENLEAKQSLFQHLDELTDAEVPLMSNTSGIPISDLAQRVKEKGRVGGSHFVQPGHIVPVLEVIRTETTTDEIMDKVTRMWQRLGRFPIKVERDIPGFLINRLQHAVIREAVHLLATGVASAEDIDQAFRLGLAPRFTTAGPLMQRDINGLRMHVSVATHLWKHLGGWEDPLAYLQAMVDRGEYGLDAGKGYYDWQGQDPAQVRASKDEQLLRRTVQVMEDWERENSQN